MSGAMMPQQGGQMPPQILAALMAAQQQQQPPAHAQASGPAQAQIAGPTGPAPTQPVPRPMPGNMGPQGQAQQGRMGDTMMAHMTPGEVAVPPQVQTPELMAAIQRAFAQAGVSPEQFTAGSPYASQNPATGQQEFSLWSALLPIAGAALGSFIPGIGTAAGMAIGGGLGGAAGGLLDHTGPMGALLGAAGGAAGGYIGGGGLGNLFGSGAGAAASGATGAAASPAAGGIAGASPFGSVGQTALMGDATRAAAAPITSSELGQIASSGMPLGSSPSLMSRLLPASIAGVGAGLGESLAPVPQTSAMPDGFNKPMDPLNRNYGQLLGSNQATAPNFTNYSPYSAVMGPNPGYNFYPVTG